MDHNAALRFSEVSPPTVKHAVKSMQNLFVGSPLAIGVIAIDDCTKERARVARVYAVVLAYCGIGPSENVKPKRITELHPRAGLLAIGRRLDLSAVQLKIDRGEPCGELGLQHRFQALLDVVDVVLVDCDPVEDVAGAPAVSARLVKIEEIHPLIW
jgi:hypothetical protein